MNKARMISWTGLLLLCVVLTRVVVFGQVEGPSGHFYKVVIHPGLTWEQARASAEESVFNGLHGHLATITSAEEDEFIEELRLQASPGGYGSLWVGGSQLPNAAGPASDWYWVNGEGLIPPPGSDLGYSNWQPGEPNDYGGPGSEMYLTVGHFNTFGWNDDPPGTHVEGYVVEYPNEGTRTTVWVGAIDPIATEPLQVIATRTEADGTDVIAPVVDTATFRFTREGDYTLDLPVFYSVHGTALNGTDYNQIAQSIIIPAGEKYVDVVIVPRPDPLTVVEPMETVGLRIEPSPILTPKAAYRIDPYNREAPAVIFEGRRPLEPQIEIAVPRDGFSYHLGEEVKILAATSGGEPPEMISFRAGETLLGTAVLSAKIDGVGFYQFVWRSGVSGSFEVRAEATMDGEEITSKTTTIVILESPATPVVSIHYVEPDTTEPWPDMDFAPGRLEVRRTGSTAGDLQVFYAVSGTATAGTDYEELPGYVVIGAGRTTARLNVVVKDDVLPEPDETIMVALVPTLLHAQTFAPAGYRIDPEHDSASLVIHDNDSMPVISITAEPVEISEPRLNALTTIPTQTKVRVSRTGSVQFPQPVSLGYSGTATPDEDYKEALPEIVIPEGSATAEFTLEAVTDNLAEGTETAIVHVMPLMTEKPDAEFRPYTMHPERGQVSIKILDANAAEVPTVSLWRIRALTVEPGPLLDLVDVAPAVFAVRRTGGTDRPLEVALRYEGTATPGHDYPELPPVVVIPEGETEAQVEFYAFDDNSVEGDETVLAILPVPADTTSARYKVDPERHTVKMAILDNDAPPGETFVSIQSTDPEATEFPPGAEAYDPARFQITRRGDLSRGLAVFFSAHGTAVNGEDYESLPQMVKIPAGEESVEIVVVPVSNDQNGMVHHYQIVQAPGLSWQQARALAEDSTYEGVAGHLATITSAEEDARIEALRMEAGGPVLWVGGYQDPNELSITEGWQWVNGEGEIPGFNGSDEGYANWLAGEPNDYWGPGTENHMAIGWLNTFGWNDQGENIGAQGYVVEYELATPVPPETEGMETVALKLEASPLFTPLLYRVDPERDVAGAVIYERQPPAEGAVEIAFPSAEGVFPRADDVEFLAAAYHPTIRIRVVEFYVDGQKVGTSELPNSEDAPAGLVFHGLAWPGATAGRHLLVARALLSNNQALESSEIPFVVFDPSANKPPTVVIAKPNDGAVFIEGEPIDFLAEASDEDGTVVKIELLHGTEVIAAAEGARLEHTLENLAVGTHLFSARAIDDDEAVGTSRTIQIRVRHRDEVAFVHRNLPETYSPGVPFAVELRATPPAGTHAYAVEDRPPEGWTVSEVSHGGVFDGVTGKVKFGPYTDAEPRALTYLVTPPLTATGRHEFVGHGSVNGALYPIVGDRWIELVAQYHPADQDENFAIVLAEVTAYAAAWKAGEWWPDGPVPIPVEYVTKAGSIWKRGEEYHFDPTQGPAPDCWVPGSGSGLRGFSVASAVRTMEPLSGGAQAQVRIAANPGAGTACYALEEKPPRGWMVSNISQDGVFDERTGTIRWGTFFDNTAREFTYTIIPPETVAAVGMFTGAISADGQMAEISAFTAKTDGMVPIQILGCSLGQGGVTLEISGPPGQTAVIESTEDFSSWQEVQSIFIPNGVMEFQDVLDATNSHRFYRLRVQ